MFVLNKELYKLFRRSLSSLQLSFDVQKNIIIGQSTSCVPNLIMNTSLYKVTAPFNRFIDLKKMITKNTRPKYQFINSLTTTQKRYNRANDVIFSSDVRNTYVYTLFPYMQCLKDTVMHQSNELTHFLSCAGCTLLR